MLNINTQERIVLIHEDSASDSNRNILLSCFCSCIYLFDAIKSSSYHCRYTTARNLVVDSAIRN